MFDERVYEMSEYEVWRYWCGGVGLVVDEFVFFQAEDGIRDLGRSRGLGDVYKRQGKDSVRLRQAFPAPV